MISRSYGNQEEADFDFLFIFYWWICFPTMRTYQTTGMAQNKSVEIE
jgi:hypothetical protein